MNRKERTAAMRVITDLVMADHVIDAGELHFLEEVRSTLGITASDEADAAELTLAEAVRTLRGCPAEELATFRHLCLRMTVSDGYCARAEALLISALDMIIQGKGEMMSLPASTLSIPSSCVVYVEGSTHEDYDEAVSRDYRSIANEFRLAGFEFIYIPHISRHYRTADPVTVDAIVAFLAPTLSPQGRLASIDRLTTMTTPAFCCDILCNKLGMKELRNTAPALLLKVGTSYVSDNVYANYITINLDSPQTLLQRVRDFTDDFSALVIGEHLMVSNRREHAGSFLYHGFYKMLLDVHLMMRNIRSRIVVDPGREVLYFSDIDLSLQGLHRREKALYALLLKLSATGGIDFSKPEKASELQAYNARMDAVQRLYGAIYSKFGGEREKAPDLGQPELRRPMFSRINSRLRALAGRLDNVDDYLISRGAAGSYCVHLPSSYVEIQTLTESVPLEQWQPDK